MDILETKAAERLKVVEAALKAQEDQTKQHQAYLQSHHDAKPEDAQTLTGFLKYFDEELNKMKVAMADPMHKQKMMHDAKRMIHD